MRPVATLRAWAGRNQFLANAGAYTSGRAVEKAAMVLLMPLWAYFLTEADYGITGTMLVYGWMLNFVYALGLNQAAIRNHFTYEDEPERQKTCMSSLLVFQAGASTMILVALNILGPPFWERFTAGQIPFDPYVRLMIFAVYLEVLLRIPLALYMARKQARQYVSIQYSRCGLGIIAGLVFIVGLRMGAYGVMLSQLVTAGVVTGIVLPLVCRRLLSRHFEFAYVRRGLAFGLPLIPHLAALWVINASNRAILEYHVSIDELGLYNFGYMIGMGLMLLVNGINQAWIPYFYGYMRDESTAPAKIIRVISNYIAYLGGICLFGMLFAPEAVYLIFPERYYGSIPFIAPILLGCLWTGFYYFAANPLQFHHRTILMPIMTGAAALLNIGLNLWLIPKYGAIATAWVTMGSYAFLFQLYYLAGKRYLHFRLPMVRFGIPVAMLVGVGVFTSGYPVPTMLGGLVKVMILILYGGIAFALLLRRSPEAT